MAKREGKRYSNGKRIDTWKVTIDGTDLAIEVFMRHEPWGTSFTAYCAKPYLEIEGVKDLDKLRKDASAQLREKLSVSWEPILVVEVTGLPYSYGSESRETAWRLRAGITLHARSEERATIDGKKMTRSGPAGRPWERWTTPKREPRRPNWSGHDTDENTTAVIPDTPENRLALERVKLAIDAAHTRLLDLLDPNAIQESLLRVLAADSTPLLVAESPRTTEVGGGLHVRPLGSPIPADHVTSEDDLGGPLTDADLDVLRRGARSEEVEDRTVLEDMIRAGYVDRRPHGYTLSEDGDKALFLGALDRVKVVRRGEDGVEPCGHEYRDGSSCANAAPCAKHTAPEAPRTPRSRRRRS
jgi:hypothetical protein